MFENVDGGTRKFVKRALIAIVVVVAVIAFLFAPRPRVAGAAVETDVIKASQVFYINVTDPATDTQYHIAVSELIRSVLDLEHDQYGLWLEASVSSSPLPQEAQ